MNTTWLVASIAATGVALTHVILGGREIARPLLNARDMHDVARYTNYFCWHMVTIVLFGQAAAFAWAAVYPDGYELAVAATMLSVLFTLWNLGLVFWKGQSLILMPQWMLFIAVTIPGVWGALP